jgi:hypothetical protein
VAVRRVGDGLGYRSHVCWSPVGIGRQACQLVGGGEVLLLVVVCAMITIAVLMSASVETPH